MSIFAGTDLFQPPKCDRCEKLAEECECEPLPPEAKQPGKQTARLQVEKRKRGKLMTVVRGLSEGNPEPHLSNLLTKLKNHVGAGGTISDGNIEIQGDHRERLGSYLSELGFKVKST